MPGLKLIHVSKGATDHDSPWYWLYNTNEFLSFTSNDFVYPQYLGVEKYFHSFSEQFSEQKVTIVLDPGVPQWPKEVT